LAKVSEAAGFEWVRCQGSHNTFRSADGRIIVIPDHGQHWRSLPCRLLVMAIRARAEAVQERQRQRFTGTRLLSNVDMGPAEVRDYGRVDDAGVILSPCYME
jgi:predicted RNA binding protein YcfA (HicA-like mRNA interferase family)